MIVRDIAPLLRRAATTMPVVMLTGPRHSGKTQLCQALFPGHPYRTLEAPDARAFALGDPRSFLAELTDGAVIDEIQRAPALLAHLQGIVDDDPRPGRWILAGSQNRPLSESTRESISRSLAGRTGLYELLPLAWGEIRRVARPPASLDQALFTGGYPEILDRALDPTAWLRSCIGRYLERDVRTIVNVGNLASFQRFVELCASRTGQLLNYSSLATDCGISPPTARQWVDVLETSFIVFRLPAFRGDTGKRLLKAPKLYFYDTGLVCCLLGIHERRQLRSHPLRDAIFKTWVVSEALKNRANRGLGPHGPGRRGPGRRGPGRRGLTFYRDPNGVAADLVIDHARGRTLLEARSAGAPSSDMLGAVRRVRNHLPASPASDPVVVYGGDERQQWADGELLPWRMVRTATLCDGTGVVQVLSGGRPVPAAHVLAVSPIHPNVRWKSGTTDAWGEAILDLDARRLARSPAPSVPLTLPLTLFVAAPGLEAWLEPEWLPAERALAIDLARLSGGGGVIFPQGSGDVPGLTGHVTINGGGFSSSFGGTFGTTFDTVRIRAENIAINGEVTGGVSREPQRPVYIRPGTESHPVHLEDADGRERWIRVLGVVGRSALVEYRREPPGHPHEPLGHLGTQR